MTARTAFRSGTRDYYGATLGAIARIGSWVLLLIMGTAGCRGNAVKHVISPPTGLMTVYVANSGSNTVTPIPVASNKPSNPIRVASGPQQIVISPDDKIAYVASHVDLPRRSAQLTAIRTGTNTAGKILTVCKAGDGDHVTMAITPDGGTLYYLCPTAGRVIPIRTKTMTVGRPINAGPYPDAIAITPDGRTAYVANAGSTTVTPITVATNKAGKPIQVGLGPDAIAITPDGRTAYAVTPYHVTPISTATNTPGKPINVRGGHAIVITPDGATTYVVSTPNPDSYQGVVAPIHVATNTSGRPIRVGKAPSHIAITPDGTMAYVTNLGSGTVTPIRVVNGTADKAIRVGMAPADLTITPDGKVVYVVNSILCLPGPCGMVTPIRVATGTAGAPVRVGRFPLGIAISS